LIFEAAAAERTREAFERPELFDAGCEWNTLARLQVAWIAAPENPSKGDRWPTRPPALAAGRSWLIWGLVQTAPAGIPALQCFHERKPSELKRNGLNPLKMRCSLTPKEWRYRAAHQGRLTEHTERLERQLSNCN
jgi:hypothetical protein